MPLHEAQGGVLAHSLTLADGVLRKGTILDASHVERLRSSGLEEVTVARLDTDDVSEDEAARAIATALAHQSIKVERAVTGRANLFAQVGGVLTISREAIDAANMVDEAITVATLDALAAVEAGRMIATVKIIPYAVPRSSLDAVLRVVGGATGPVLEVRAFRPLRVAVVSTMLPGTPGKVIDKTVRTLGARLAPAGATLIAERRIPHAVDALSTTLGELGGAELVVVFGASAIADRRDVIPAAIESAGGSVEHFGMPVDPGNLLLLGRIGATPVVGAPGCARSPKENGFDWVLQRVLAGVAVTREDIMRLGVGGLLMEIGTRPQPRQAPPVEEGAPAKVAVVVLAAGQSRRMGGPNKLVAEMGGEPLVRIAARAALESRAARVVVVTGHEAERVEAALDGLDLQLVRNPHYAEGLSTSLRAGLAALPPEIDAALVMLADMPAMTPAILARLIDAYNPTRAPIVVPTAHGKRGNPVLWSRRYFEALGTVRGDVGGRHLLGEHPDAVVEVEVGAAATLDLDTPEALAAAGGSHVGTVPSST